MSAIKQDLEAAKAPGVYEVSADGRDIVQVVDLTGSQQRHQKPSSNVVLRHLNAAETWLNEKLNIETQGIDRVLEDEKQPPSMWNMLLLYWGLICHIGIVPIGLVGPVFGFTLRQSACGIVVGTMIGALCPAFTATLSPLTGLRAIASSRYSFGFWGAKLPAILNIFSGGSYLIINFITVSEILSAVSGYTLSLSVGSVIIAIISYIVSLFGFHIIHRFEKYSWIVAFVLLCVLLGQAGPHIGSSTVSSQITGNPSNGLWLTFFAVTISATASWCSFVGDYYCHYPASTKRWKVFSLTWVGLVLPTTFTMMVGACIGHAAINTQYPPYAEALANHGFGGLVYEIYQPHGWSKFCLVILTFTVLGNNVGIIYSSGLSLQLLGHVFHAVPRFVWSLVFAIVTAVLATAGQDHLISVVSNSVALVGYWGIAFVVVLLIEDQWFRRGHPEKGYDLLVWNQPRGLPPGVAGVTALLAGYLAGGVTGMAQTWYVGPIAADPNVGGDVGLYLTALIATAVYFPLRHLERKISGR